MGFEIEGNKVVSKGKGENELAMANKILGIVANLSDENEAIEFARLYLKAQKEAVKIAGEEYEFGEKEVMRIVAEVDRRFDEVDD